METVSREQSGRNPGKYHSRLDGEGLVGGGAREVFSQVVVVVHCVLNLC